MAVEDDDAVDDGDANTLTDVDAVEVPLIEGEIDAVSDDVDEFVDVIDATEVEETEPVCVPVDERDSDKDTVAVAVGDMSGDAVVESEATLVVETVKVPTTVILAVLLGVDDGDEVTNALRVIKGDAEPVAEIEGEAEFPTLGDDEADTCTTVPVMVGETVTITVDVEETDGENVVVDNVDDDDEGVTETLAVIVLFEVPLAVTDPPVVKDCDAEFVRDEFVDIVANNDPVPETVFVPVVEDVDETLDVVDDVADTETEAVGVDGLLNDRVMTPETVGDAVVDPEGVTLFVDEAVRDVVEEGVLELVPQLETLKEEDTETVGVSDFAADMVNVAEFVCELIVVTVPKIDALDVEETEPTTETDREPVPVDETDQVRGIVPD